MRKDTSFLERKLTPKEFSEKYWESGRLPYQYHTGNIEDGRDEREQFLFNNCRALWNTIWHNNDFIRKVISEQENESEKRDKRIAMLVAASTAISIALFLILLFR